MEAPPTIAVKRRFSCILACAFEKVAHDQQDLSIQNTFKCIFQGLHNLYPLFIFDA